MAASATKRDISDLVGRWPLRLEGLLEGEAGREHERVRAGPAGDLDRGGKALLGRAAGQGQSGPAEGVEGVREPDQRLPDGELVDVGVRGDERERRREEQVEVAERLQRLVAQRLAPGRRLLDLRVADGEAALDLGTDVVAVELSVL